MKNKKLISLICAAALSLAACGLASGCGDTHEHSVPNWKTSRESTCVSPGEEYGECAECGDVVIRETPADPSDLTKHSYGEWVITEPTESRVGSASKTCSESCTENHVHTVELPTLGDSSYRIGTVKEADLNEEGKKSYTLADAAGDITFTVTVPKLQISNVGDAIEVAKYNSGKVRETNANILGESLYSDYVKNNPTGRVASCYFGDDYVHILDESERVDDWYSYDEQGNVFGIRTSNRTSSNETLTENIDASENNMKGFNFSLGFSEISDFGAEGLLTALHNHGSEKGTNYAEKLASENGGEYEFAFDAESATISVHVTVKFRLGSAGMLEKLKVEEVAYEKYKFNLSTGEYIFDEDGKLIPEESGRAENAHYAGLISLTQTAKKDTDVVPENKYDYRQRYVQSFDVLFNGAEVGANAVTVGANAGTSFTFENVFPTSSSLDYDQPQIYLRKESRDVLLSINSGSEGVIAFYNVGENSFTVNSVKTGELTIVVKTRGMSLFDTEEKVIKLNVTKLAPSRQDYLVADYYEYNDAGGMTEYNWTQIKNGGTVGNTAAEQQAVYVGQTLVFKLGVDNTNEDALREAGYVDLSFTSAVFRRNSSDVNEETTAATLTNVDKDSGEGLLYDAQVVKFTATEAGRYTLRLYSAIKPEFFRYVIITVSEKPDISGYFADGAKYKCDIEAPESAKVEVTVTNTDGWKKGKFTVTVDLSKTAVFTYSVDEATGEITCSYESGATDVDTRTGVDRYAFALKLNEVYKLELTHPTGFVDKDGENDIVYYETRVLTAEQD